MKQALLLLLILLVIGTFGGYWATRTETRLLGFDADDGSVLFSADLPTGRFGTGTAIGSDLYFLWGDETMTLFAYDLIDGDVSWQWQPEGEYDASESFRQAPYSDWQYVYLSVDRPNAPDQLVAIERDSGAVAWTVAREWEGQGVDYEAAITTVNDLIFYLDQPNRDQAMLVAIDRMDGREMWRTPLDGWLRSILYAGDFLIASAEIVAVVTEESLTAYNTQMGDLLWRNEEIRFGDSLTLLGDTLLVGTTRKLFSVDVNTGSPVWMLDRISIEGAFVSVPRSREATVYARQQDMESRDWSLVAYPYRSVDPLWSLPTESITLGERFFAIADGVARFSRPNWVETTTLTVFDARDGQQRWEVESADARSYLIVDDNLLVYAVEDTRWNLWSLQR